MTPFVQQVAVNVILLLLAALVSGVNIFLLMRVHPSAPYLPMWRSQVIATTLEMIVALVLGIAIWEVANGAQMSLTAQWRVHTLMGAALLCSASVALSRLLFELLARHPQIDATQRLMDDLRQQVTACTRH